MSLDKEFRFGEWKGHSIEEVINTKPDYIRWAVRDSVIELDNEAYEYFNDTYPDDTL